MKLVSNGTTANEHERIITAANEVAIAMTALTKALQSLEAVATTDELKSECLSQASGQYTRKNLIVYALQKEGLTLVK